MAVVLAGTGLFLYLRLEAQLNRDVDRDLHSRAEQLTALIHASDAAGLGESVRSVLARQGDSFAQIVTRSGRLFDPRAQRGRPVLAGAELERARRGTILFERSNLPGLGDDPVRLEAGPVRQEEGRRLIVVVGASLANRDETLGNLATLLLIGGPVALLLASLAAYGATRAALRPVDAMRRRAAEISAAEAEQRLPLSPAQDEVRRLGETLNRMLDRLQAAVERERAFVDDASHELRTPLALHKTELELALRYGGSTEELRAQSPRRSRRPIGSRSWPRTSSSSLAPTRARSRSTPGPFRSATSSPRSGVASTVLPARPVDRWWSTIPTAW